MKRNIKLPVVVAMATALTFPSMAATEFPDVMSDAWYTKAVESAVSNGLLNGYEDGTMRPQGFVTRAEIATIFSKAFAAEKTVSLRSFDDIKAADWFYDSMAKAVNMGLFVGDSNDCLNPNSPITREETAVVVTKAFDLVASKENILSKFVDEADVSNWAVPYLSALVENGYMSGDDLGRLNPKGNITRAELAQIMSNITNNYIVEKGTVSDTYEGTVVVRVPGVTLKDSKVAGDVVVADGVGTGEFTLDNVEIEGNLVVRGGGVNSVKILNKSKIKGKIVLRNPNGKTRIHSTQEIDAEIEINSPVIIDAKCEKVIVNDSVDVEVTGTVETIEVNAENVEVSGKGDVKTVSANADDIKVTVKGAEVNAAEGVTGVEAGSKEVKAGETETVKTTGSAGGGGGSSSSTTPTEVAVTISITKNENTGFYQFDVTSGEFSDFDNKEYKVSVTGLVTISNRTVSDGVEALTLAKDVLTNDNINYLTLMQSIDNRKNMDDFDAEKDYDRIKAIITGAAEMVMPDDENYKKLKETEAELIGDGTIKDVSFEEFYKEFTGKNGNLKQFIVELYDAAIEGENSTIVKAIIDVCADEFVKILL